MCVCVLLGKLQRFNKQIQCNPDTRLQISTNDAVKEDSDLYREVLPLVDGHVVLPIELKKDGSPFIPKRTKKIVNTVRHVEKCEMFTNGSIDAR